MRQAWVGAVVFAGLAGVVAAQEPPAGAVALRFKWEAGKAYTYGVEELTTVTEQGLDEATNKPAAGPTTTTIKRTLTRRWAVTAVDAAGTATVDMAITAFRQETTKPAIGKDGKPATQTDVLDSADPARAKDLPYLNKVLYTAKVDARGQVVEITSPLGDAAVAPVQAELPFRVVLADKPVAPTAAWSREYKIKLPPPAGTGDEYEAVQRYTLKGLTQGYAVIGLATALKTPPASAGERQPLAPMLWEGDVYLHAATGLYGGARLTIKQELANHQGDGTRWSYESRYTEAVK